MRALADSTGRRLPPLETPSADALRVNGDLSFLAFRSPRHQQMQLAVLRRYIEPPVMLGQFRIFRIDEVPRAAVTGGFLSETAERKLIAGDALDPEDWRAGDRMWIIDLMAPYKGLTRGIVRWLMVPGNLTRDSFRFRHVDG
ncbi:RTX toxin-activating lysine-acyltransferase (type I secretion system) [Roseibacterium elongatum DSM 19469]|uniref:RTX toxin-activating lysine-acyltransferase n=1 Tax=Roseicyclus elongatus DSM 19469 TaxID=1294273 RepID=W8S434_9RHOB|nr:toxin-activating lysine-acyltransferase [Roseibacterium elongatum]AHM03546.1 RTX toxin-activating lysine-acyltransferase (type I secretion system) [Roseibacterium elongatum DSM 19469]